MDDAVATPRAVDLCNAAAAACEGVPDLQAAIVFGSVLSGKDPRDLDLALLWSPELPTAERWQRANRIASDLEHRIVESGLGVDVKDLRSLPLALQFRVLRDGRQVYVPDRQAMVRFQSETIPLALDFLPFRQRALEASARRLARG
jgi:predicted nucleotidyltransferase